MPKICQLPIFNLRQYLLLYGILNCTQPVSVVGGGCYSDMGPMVGIMVYWWLSLETGEQDNGKPAQTVVHWSQVPDLPGQEGLHWGPPGL